MTKNKPVMGPHAYKTDMCFGMKFTFPQQTASLDKHQKSLP